MDTLAQAKPQAGTKTFLDARWVSGLQSDYETGLVNEWSPYFGALALVAANVVLMLSGLFWGITGGFKLWGDYLMQFAGLGGVLGISAELDHPLLHRISLMDITLVLGAFSAALLSRQFALRRPPKLEYATGAAGGILMGIGATLAGGCTTGGFFTPLLFSSASGWAMWAGLLGGAFLGLKALLWVMEHVTWGTAAPAGGEGNGALKRLSPLVGVLVLSAVVWWAASWLQAGDEKLVNRVVIILAGFALGFILHRSRFCFARVFREPFMTAEGEMTKAMMLALAVGIPLGALLIQHKTVDPFLAIPATFWLGSPAGGAIFGIGMVFAGGCGSGSLWRAGEGHLKLWVAILFFSLSNSVAAVVFKRWDLLTAELNLDMIEVTKVGYQAYLPNLLGGWGWVFVASGGLLLLWYLLVRYNESTERFTVL
jgi:hypothetical protein